ncbi:hypothetical protein G4Z16_07110 [Streptomyces bathyalis]|uniref:Uncharacterized protein n=1 Tax=Streptomyces bathyalis TaxID=2710756 RepID=A0A7T1T4E1_9ACTN|nr:hypothetical protein [Streptomyces bathyalis]QPP06201.1 hypothetical protein G4Z16_07110 [Streptomyces bathyalis]
MTRQRPTPDEAARALTQVGQREEQAINGGTSDALWVRLVIGLLLFGSLAARDFLGSDANSWISIGFALLIVLYAILLRTRRGSSALGRSARVDMRSATARNSTGYTQWVPFAIVVLALAVGLTGARLDLPYWHTALGAVLAAILIFFGPALERALLSAGKRGPGKTDAARP